MIHSELGSGPSTAERGGPEQFPAIDGKAGKAPGKTRTRSEIAKSNLARGKADERKVVSYLRVAGFPGAERTVRTGYRAKGREGPDRGDIDGTPGIAWQIKSIAEREWWRIPGYLVDTRRQADAAGADVGVLVVRRAGHGHPAEWWAHMYLHEVVGILGYPHDQTPPDVPVRFELRHLIPMLRDAGYGTPPETDDPTTEDGAQ